MHHPMASDLEMDASSATAPYTTPLALSASTSTSSSQTASPGAEPYAMIPGNTPQAPPSSYLDIAVNSSRSLWASSASSSSSSLSSKHLLDRDTVDMDMDPLILEKTFTADDNFNHHDASTMPMRPDNMQSCDYNNTNANSSRHLPSSLQHQKQEQALSPAQAPQSIDADDHVSQPGQEQEQEQEVVVMEPSMDGLKRYPAIPSELILHVFKFLTAPQDLRSALLVCKLWCSCGIDLFWSRPALVSLTVAHKMCNTMSLDRSETVFPYADYIRRLNFSFLAQDLTDDVVEQFRCCTRLERLLLPGCSKTTEFGLKQILRVGQGLYSLDLSDIPAVTDDVLEHVATFCPKLHTLYLTGCASLTDESIVKLAASCTSLKRIKLGQCVLLTDRSVLALTQHCPQLMEIDVTNCSLMTNNIVQSVFQTLPQIRDFNVTLLGNLTDQAFSSIPLGPTTSITTSMRFDQLRVLNLTSCVHITDETLARIIPAAPRLRNLALTKCDRITDVGASVIKLLGKHLHYLHLGHCSKLTDKAITTLTQHCTRIRYLDLACCSKLTDAAVFAMAQLPKLRRIGLVKCSNITDHGIYAMLVSQIVPQTLERVHLSYCVHLTDTAVAALVNQCSKLTHLSVTGVPAFMSPRYQKFCRVPPSEFTAHQREVFCVFSGKGVRELRQFMNENPVPPTSLSSIQRSYRLMGSSVASMVAGGQHSASLLAHLEMTLRETEAQVQILAVQSGNGGGGSGASASAAGGNVTSISSSSSGQDHGTTLASLSVQETVAVGGSSWASEEEDNDVDQQPVDGQQYQQPHYQYELSQERDATVLDLERQIGDLVQAEHNYTELMMQQYHLLRRHHHRYRLPHRHQSHDHSHTHHHHHHHHHLHLNGLGSGSTSATGAQGSSSILSSSSSSSSSSSPSRIAVCPCRHGRSNLHDASMDIDLDMQVSMAETEVGIEVAGQDSSSSSSNHNDGGDDSMASPSPEGQEPAHVQREASESAGGSSGGSGHGSPAEEEEDDEEEEEEEEVDLDEDLFADGDEDDHGARSSRSRRR